MEKDMDEIICYCSSVTRGDIIEALKSGARDYKAVSEMTGAGTIGKCKELNPKGK